MIRFYLLLVASGRTAAQIELTTCSDINNVSDISSDSYSPAKPTELHQDAAGQAIKSLASFQNSPLETLLALPLQEIIRGMSKGTVMYKVRAPDRCYKRRYRIDVQNMQLSYSPSSKPFWYKKKTIFDIYEIQEIRKGWNTDVFNRLEAKFRRHLQATFHPQLQAVLKEENCFSLIIGPHPSIVDLIAPNVHTRDAWVRGLNHLLATCKSNQKKQDYNRWLKEQVRKADVNDNGSLNFDECLILLNQLNISMNRKDAKRLFNAANFRKIKIDREDVLDPEEFVHFYHSLLQRPEVEELMKRYSVSKTTIIGSEELQIFLEKEQKMLCTLEECQNMIEKYEPEQDRIPEYMTLRGFQEMLLSVDHDIFNKRHRFVHQDMSHPLSHYYIASSHNTYLMQGQLIGESSIEGYIQALLRGCRCLELDTWDGPDSEPTIFHGYTLTSCILFRDVLDAIKQYAFQASQYPVILSLENHCSIPQQKKMAHYLISILGEYLYKTPVDEDETTLPSPNSFARKILIKAKKLKEDNLEELFEDEEEQERVDATLSIPSDSCQAPAAAMVHHKELAKELSDLVNYCKTARFASFLECFHSWKFYEMASFQENKALNLAAEHGKEFVSYNKIHLSRIYPKGTRTDSSNLDPIPHWNAGCQMVALNYQTWDKPMFLYEAKFAQNGHCGYILKPNFLRSSDDEYDPALRPDPIYKQRLIITVISGQHIPKPGQALEGEIIDPYVCIKVCGHPLDKQKVKTKYISNNGFNPLWNEIFTLTFHMPELAMVMFSVKDQNSTGKNEILGQFALPFTSITDGYRHIHLKDTKGQSIVPASLFVHTTILCHGTVQTPKKFH